jgi:hypothetical protein
MAWIAVGLLIAISMGAMLFRWVRLRSKGKRVEGIPPSGDVPTQSDDASAHDRSSNSVSATRWLHSLVKAEGTERTKRGGGS